MHQRGPALVRVALFSLLFGSLALALVQPSMAGSEAAPEVTDAAGDAIETTAGLVPGGDDADLPPPLGSNTANVPAIDILKGYVQGSNTSVLIGLVFAGDVAATATYNVTFNIVSGASNKSFSVQRAGSATGITGPSGTAAASSGPRLNFTIPTLSLNVSAGATLTNLTIRAQQTTAAGPVALLQPAKTTTDTAGPGTPYTFTSPPADDLDADGILDDCEERFFGGTTAQSNASADSDGDGLTTVEECALGTDPTKADSDGDGVNDDTDPFPSDPSRGAATGTATTTSSSRPSSSSTTTKTFGATSSSSTGDAAAGSGAPANLDEALERLKTEAGYLGASMGGLVAVLVLAILALAVRWSL